MKICFEFAKNGTCQNGDNCWFGHVSPSEASKMGFTPPPNKGGKGGKNPNKGGKNAAAAEQQPQQPSNGQPVVAAHKFPVATLVVVEQTQQHQDRQGQCPGKSGTD